MWCRAWVTERRLVEEIRTKIKPPSGPIGAWERVMWGQARRRRSGDNRLPKQPPLLASAGCPGGIAGPGFPLFLLLQKKPEF